MENLRLSFPNYSEEQINGVAKKYYAHLCDLVVETIKSFSMSEHELSFRFACANPESVKEILSSNKTIVLITGHYNNWEWGGLAFARHFGIMALGIYNPLTNSFWNTQINAMRSRFGLQMIAMDDTAKYFRQYASVQKVVGFAADQTPAVVNKSYWIKFLNHDTPVHRGPARFARMFDCIMVYGNITKIARSQYEVRYEVLEKNAADKSEDELSHMHVRKLEGVIISKPEHWLWSHRRWKRAPPPGTIINH